MGLKYTERSSFKENIYFKDIFFTLFSLCVYFQEFIRKNKLFDILLTDITETSSHQDQQI